MRSNLISENQPFDRHFEVVLADTPESKQIHYSLRYQVYCEEMDFVDKDRFPDQLEYDDWDDGAIHFLVRHKISGHWLGGLRLVFQKSGRFPFEDWCTPYIKIGETDRRTSTEISRLCIVKEGRRFSSKRFAPYGLPDEEFCGEDGNVKSLFDYKNQSRSLMWGLIRAATAYSAQHNMSGCYFFVAPALARFLIKGGLDLRQIGEPSDHKGLRIPYRLTVENALRCQLWLEDYKNEYRLYSDLTHALPEALRACV